MKKAFFYLVIFTPSLTWAQCPFPVTQTSSGGNCLGATLTVNSAAFLSQIDWYNGNTVVQTVTAASNGATGVTVAGGNGPGSAPNQQYDVWSVYVDNHDTVYVADVGNERIQQWAPGAQSGVTVAGGHGTGNAANQFNGATGVFVDGGGNIYVVDQFNERVQKWARGAVSGITVAGGNGAGVAANQLNNPLSLFVDGIGNIYVAESLNSRISKWASGATSGVTVAGGYGSGSAANQFNGTESVFVDGSGNIYVADGFNHRIQEWAPGATSGLTVAGGNGAGAAANQFNVPDGLYVDGSGNLYVADLGNNRIQKWAPRAASGITVAGGNGPGNAANQLAGPSSVWVDGNGNIFISDLSNYRIQKWGPQTSIPTTYTPITPGTYTARVTYNAGCAVTTNAIIINPIVTPAVSIGTATTTICVGTPVTFTAMPSNGGTTPSYQWQWNGTNVSTNADTYTNSSLANGDIVSCTLTSNAVCATVSTVASNPISVVVTTGVVPTVHISASDTKICSGTPVEFTASVTNGSSSPSYQWFINGDPVGGNSADFTSKTLINGDTVSCVLSSASSACFAAASDDIILTVADNPSVPGGQTFSISRGQGIQLDPVLAGDITQYQWSPGTGLSDSTIQNPVANPAKTTIYELQVTTVDGCEAKGEITVNVFTQLKVPSAFTPNGDGRNDVFYVLGGPAGSRIKDFSIFNRWGEMVFHVHDVAPNDPQYGWNGYQKGSPASVGVYVYILSIILVGGQEQLLKGSVVLIR